jgi:glutamine amidotransferase
VNRVAIVDYGMCNLDSVCRAVDECGGHGVITSDPSDIEAADRIILPGVGAFTEAMANLRARDLDKVLDEQVRGQGAPFLGICLGMQMLAQTGYEGEPTPGLGWIAADVVRLEPTATDRRVPHIGWNEVYPRSDCPLFEDTPDGTDFYFVHSYHVACREGDLVAATTPYCDGFSSAVWSGSVFGVQFHAEKSQRAGFAVLRRFLAI